MVAGVVDTVVGVYTSATFDSSPRFPELNSEYHGISVDFLFFYGDAVTTVEIDFLLSQPTLVSTD